MEKQLMSVSPVIPNLQEREITIAKDQQEYLPLKALVAPGPHSVVLTRWTFSPEQREAITQGEDLWLQCLTFGQHLQPVQLTIGVPDHGIEYDNSGDIFDSIVGKAVRGWSAAVLAISQLSPDKDKQITSCHRELLKALHKMVAIFLSNGQPNFFTENQPQ